MIDQIIVFIYLVMVLIIGLLVGRDTTSLGDFAVGKRNFSTVVLVSTVFATVIDGGGTIGLAETVYSLGPIYCMSFLGIALSYLGLAFFVGPKFDPFLGLLSSGDILGKLYGTRAKIFMGFATIFESVMLIGMQVLAITHLMQYFFAMPSTIAACGSSLIILLYSFRGGIKAVTATDVFQFGMLIVAIPLMGGIVLYKIGGLDALFAAIKTPPKSLPEIDYLKQFAIFFSFSLPAIFPRTIQRMLMAKHTEQIKTTFIFNGLLCIPFYLIIGVIAISAWILSPTIESSLVFPNMVNEAMPIGIKGFIVAGLLAVFMSSIDSDLNLSSIAITHDIVTPLFKRPLSEKSKLQIAKGSTFIISAISILIALYFASIMEMIYFLLCISNSAFFPGYLLGFLGIKPGKTGFWCGLIAATTSVMFFTFVIDLFLLYTGLISILLNLAVLFGFHIKEKLGRNATNESDENPKRFLLSQPALSHPISKPEYSNIFSVFTLIGGLFPFFLLPPDPGIKSSPYLLLYFLSAVFSFMLLFREAWWENSQRIFKPILYTTMMISLPCASFLMYLINDYDIIWAMDLIIGFILLLNFTEKRISILIGLIGIISAITIFLIIPVYSHGSTVANCSLALHTIMLITCLILFRKRDVQRYQFLSGKLAHEASRSMSSLSSSAEFLMLKLPELVNCHEWALQNGYSSKTISKEVIEELKELPLRLQDMGQRTAKTVESLFGSICTSGTQAIKAKIDIMVCLKDAIADPSIDKKQKTKIKLALEHNFCFLGNKDQISQAILNIIENGLDAIINKNDGFIEIWTKDNTLIIKDNGIGIPRRNLGNIFDEFFSTKKTLGQGLAFCKQVMAEHNGDIYCKSEENLFTQFELRFPNMEI